MKTNLTSLRLYAVEIVVLVFGSISGHAQTSTTPGGFALAQPFVNSGLVGKWKFDVEQKIQIVIEITAAKSITYKELGHSKTADKQLERHGTLQDELGPVYSATWSNFRFQRKGDALEMKIYGSKGLEEGKPPRQTLLGQRLN